MKVLFCSDGSTAAEKAVRFAALIAAGWHAETTILGIVERAGTEDALLRSLRRSQDLLNQHNLEAELVTKAGRPVSEIVKRTEATDYDLVVIGAERRDRAPLLRPIKAYQITEAVRPPVLLFLGERSSLRRILLCHGGGVPAVKAVELTGAIAKSTQAAVTLFHVLAAAPAMFAGLLQQEQDAERVLESDSSLGRALRQQKETLTELGIACTVRLRHGLVVPELLTEVRQAEYDLVVAGSSPSRDRLRAYMLGNVTRELINHAEWPVLVVRREAVPHPRTGFVSGFFKHSHQRW